MKLTKNHEVKFDSNLETQYKCDILKYPNMLLRVFGLYHRIDDPLLYKAYALSLCFVDWFNLVRFFFVYDKKVEGLTAELILKIITNIWFFICAFLATVIYINQEKYDREPLLLKNFNWLVQNKKEMCRKVKLKIFIYIIYGLLTVIAIVNVMATVVSFFGPRFLFAGYRLFLSPFHNAEWAENNATFKLLILFITGVTSFHWCLTTAIFLSHAAILIELLRVFNLRFKNFVKTSILVSTRVSCLDQSMPTNMDENIFIDTKEKKCVCEKEFETFRLCHLKLCYAVQLLDRCYSEFIGIAVLFYTIIILLIVYIMSDWNGNCVSGIMEVLYPFWAGVSIGTLLLVVIFAAIIHNLAHDPIETLFLMEMNEYSLNVTFKVYLMISKLSSTKISLSAWGLMDITKELILKVSGTIITYLFVIMEFKERSTVINKC